MKLQTQSNWCKVGRPPSPDSYPIEFYKRKCIDKITPPLLLKMFNDSLGWGTLPRTLTEALITLLLKPDKDSSDCSSYCPISLLNADNKILAIALAVRLEQVMPNIISSDQTRFMKNLHSFSNIRCLLNILFSPALSLRHQKWWSLWMWKKRLIRKNKYTHSTLWSCALVLNLYLGYHVYVYSLPKVSVITNGMKSHCFTLSRGTCQGCPWDYCYKPWQLNLYRT